MKRLLQILAAAIVLGGLVTWLALGANRGWTKTSVPVTAVDEITGIESTSYEDRFVPGVDFLGGAVLTGGLLAGLSLLFSRRTKIKTSKHETSDV
jgi:hypothetical protein